MELASGDAGAAADIDEIAARAGVDEARDHGLWVARPGPLVTLGVRSERLGHLSGLMRLVSGIRRGLPDGR